MNNYNPEQHINEEPRNDFLDVAVGFAGFFGVLTVIFIAAIVIKALMG